MNTLIALALLTSQKQALPCPDSPANRVRILGVIGRLLEVGKNAEETTTGQKSSFRSNDLYYLDSMGEAEYGISKPGIGVTTNIDATGALTFYMNYRVKPALAGSVREDQYQAAAKEALGVLEPALLRVEASWELGMYASSKDGYWSRVYQPRVNGVKLGPGYVARITLGDGAQCHVLSGRRIDPRMLSVSARTSKRISEEEAQSYALRTALREKHSQQVSIVGQTRKWLTNPRVSGFFALNPENQVVRDSVATGTSTPVYEIWVQHDLITGAKLKSDPVITPYLISAIDGSMIANLPGERISLTSRLQPGLLPKRLSKASLFVGRKRLDWSGRSLSLMEGSTPKISKKLQSAVLVVGNQAYEAETESLGTWIRFGGKLYGVSKK